MKIIKDGNEIRYTPFSDSITTINISLPNKEVMRNEPMISTASMILTVDKMEEFAKAILEVCKEAKNYKE